MTHKDSSDSDLISFLNNNDRAAFSEIYNRYWKVLYRAAFHVLKDEESVMDIVQDVFLWLWNHKGNLQINSLKSYLLTAVKYKVANYIRKGKVREQFFAVIEEAEKVEEQVSDWFEVKELREFIQKTVETLPERWREVYELSRNEHLTNKQIAERLGISEKTVEKHMTASLKRLRMSVSKFFLSILV